MPPKTKHHTIESTLINCISKIQKFVQLAEDEVKKSIPPSENMALTKGEQLRIISSIVRGPEIYLEEINESVFYLYEFMKSLESKDEIRTPNNNLLYMMKNSVISILKYPVLASDAFYEEVFLTGIDEMINDFYETIVNQIGNTMENRKNRDVTEYWMEVLGEVEICIDTIEEEGLKRFERFIEYYNENVNELPVYINEKFDEIFEKYGELYGELDRVLDPLGDEIRKYLEADEPDISEFQGIYNEVKPK